MRMEGSCHCGAVRFACESRAPYPFMYCYCTICRKTAGSGYAVNLHADADSLALEGEAHITVYRAFLDHPHRRVKSVGERRFCRHCGSCLWVWDERWPELIHPFASAIDTPLPVPPERVHIMLNHAPEWVTAPSSAERRFGEYPDETLMQWHQRLGLVDDGHKGNSPGE